VMEAPPTLRCPVMRGLPSIVILLLSVAAAGCAPTHIKPVDTAEVRADRTPKVAALLRRVMMDETVDGQVVTTVSLKSAKLFAEGHVHETWRLDVDLGDRSKEMVLKVFKDQRKADENAVHYGFAQQYGWPIPLEIVRGTSAAPLTDRPFLIMEFVVGGTLRSAVAEALGRGGDAGVQAVAQLYGGLGAALGGLHRKSLRKRERFDVSGRKALDNVLVACAEQGWCGGPVRERLQGLLPALDGGRVAFVHGDLYESQLLMGEEGEIRAFIDLDTARFDDQARDVGSVLAHLLVINPRARQASWGVPDPTLEETEASARAFWRAYAASAGVPEEGRKDLMDRSRAYMWVRVYELMGALGGSSHGKAVHDMLLAQRVAIFVSDPFADANLEP